jgi:uncharacterized membrane protein YedE/YeeE
MRATLAGFIAGLVFGIGLALGGMTDPSIVLAFLDFAGAWNPQLLFVMAGGVAVTFVGYRMAARRPAPVWDERFFAPTATRIDAPLIGGALLFGVGWGLAGYCPGPAIASLSSPYQGVATFVVAMLAGMTAVRMIRRPAPQTTAAQMPAAADG